MGAGASTATPGDVKSWDAEKLSEVVSADEKFGPYAQTVREQKIDGNAALDLDESKLRDLGVEGDVVGSIAAEISRLTIEPSDENTSAATKLQARARMRNAQKTVRARAMTMRIAGIALRASKRFDSYQALGVTPEEIAAVKQCFDRYDLDKDNSVDPTELASAIHDMGDDGRDVDPEGEELLQLFRSIDRNNDGAIELDEFVKWWCDGSDDMDSNFYKWWFKSRWSILRKQPGFLASPVKPNTFVTREAAPGAPSTAPPSTTNEAAPADHNIEDAYAGGELTLDEIQSRITVTPITEHVIGDGADGKQPLTLKYAALSQRGYYPESLNKANQDAYKIDLDIHGGRQFFGVFDGHGTYGDYCSGFCRDNFSNSLNTMYALKEDADEAIAEAFKFTDQSMHCKQDRMSGTTAVGIIFDGRTISVPNVGDSRAIVAHRTPDGALKATALTLDQTPYRRDERERVKKTGARVLNMDQLEGLEPIHDNWDVNLGEEIDDGGDPPRVWHPTKQYPGCAFTRSLGDQVAEVFGVYSTPEISHKVLHPDDELLIVASDGVFEFLTNQTVVDMVSHYDDPLEGCRHVVSEAYRMWMIHDVRTDDITMICIQLKWGVGTEFTISPRAQAGHAAHSGITQEVRPVRRGISKAKKRHITAIHHQSQGQVADEEAPAFKLPDFAKEKTEDEIQKISAAVKGNFLFAHLNSTQRDNAISCMEYVSFADDEVIIQQGSAGDYFYVVASGAFDVFVRDALTDASEGRGRHVHHYEASDDSQFSHVFGELALMHRQPRMATVVARGANAAAWRMPKVPFEAILLKTEHKLTVQLLRKVRALHALHGNQIDRIADMVTELEFNKGDTVVSKGDELKHFYIIKHGSFAASSSKGDFTLTKTDFFNDEGLVGAETTVQRDVTATSDGAIVLQVELGAFKQVLGDYSLQEHLTAAKKRKHIGMSLGSPRADSSEEGSSDPSALQRLPPLVEADANETGEEVGLCRHKDHGSELFTVRVHSKAIALRLKNEAEVMKERVLLRYIRADAGDEIARHFFPELLRTFTDSRCLYSLFHFPCACDMSELIAGEEPGDAASGSQLTVEEACFHSAGLLLAMRHAHSMGIVLRSLAPENIMIDGSNGYARLFDLRTAKSLPEGFDVDARTYTMCGSPEYLAPEQAAAGGGDGHGFAADYWAFGILIWEMLHGATPFAAGASTQSRPTDGEEGELFSRICAYQHGESGKLPGADSMSPEALEILNGLLNPNPDARYAFGSANELSRSWWQGFNWAGLKKATLTSPSAGRAKALMDARAAAEVQTREPFAGEDLEQEDGGMLGAAAFEGF